MFTVLAFSSGTRVVGTVLGLSLVQLIDTSDPFKWRVIQVGWWGSGVGRRASWCVWDLGGVQGAAFLHLGCPTAAA